VTLFHRIDSRNWQAEIRLAEAAWQTVSLSTANYEIARERAIKMHDEIYFRYRMGLSSKTVTE